MVCAPAVFTSLHMKVVAGDAEVEARKTRVTMFFFEKNAVIEAALCKFLVSADLMV